MFSKIKEYWWPSNQSSEPKTSNESSEPKTYPYADAFGSARYHYEEQKWGEPETPREKNPHGAGRFKDVDPSNFEELEHEANVFWGNQAVQFFGGLAAGVYYTVTEKPLVNPPLDNKFYQENRQEFADRLAAVAEDPEVQASPNAIATVRLIQGQNNFQEKAGQPLPYNTIGAFLAHIDELKELDKNARGKGLDAADHNEIKDCHIKNHKLEKKAFIEGGCPAGGFLHIIGEMKDASSKEGETVIPYGSIEDAYFRPYTTEDYERIRAENKAKEESSTSDTTWNNYSSDSETENDSLTEEETISVTTYPGTFFNNDEAPPSVTAGNNNEAQSSAPEEKKEEKKEEDWTDTFSRAYDVSSNQF